MDAIQAIGASVLSIFFGGRYGRMIPPFAVAFIGSSYYFETYRNKNVWLCSIGAALVTRIWQRRRFISAISWIMGPKQSELLLEPWTEKWELEVNAEKMRLAHFFKKYDHLIQKEINKELTHMGSTAIKEIAIAKPFHDACLAVNVDPLPEDFIKDLENLGYECIGSSPHDPDYDNWFMMKNTKQEDIDLYGKGYGLHIMMPGGHESIKKMINFVHYVNSHPEERDLYGSVKKKVKDSGDKSIVSYYIQKASVVAQIMEKSQKWIKSKQ